MQKIAIHSVPRSGSTWLGAIFNSHPKVAYKFQPLFSYAFKDYLNANSTKARITEFFQKISLSEDAFLNQYEEIDKGLTPIFIKNESLTHCCYKEVRYHHILENMLQQDSDLKVILLVRNPLAVLYSWYHAPKEFRPELGWKFKDEWLNAPNKNLNRPEEFNGYTKWKESTYLFMKLKQMYPSQVHLINYKDLLKRTESEVKKAFIFSNLDFTEQTALFIKSSTSKHNGDAYSIFKNKRIDDSWKALPEDIITYIYDDLKNTVLEVYLD